jgi:retinoid hydroxylase
MSLETQTALDSLPLPPGISGLPILGETLTFFQDSDFAQKRFQRYGPVFKTHIFGQPTLFIKGSEGNQFVLSQESQLFQVQWPPSTSALLGQSLALQFGTVHQSRRKILAQAFMPRALSSYIETMQTITANYAQRWAQQHTLTWYPELRRYTLDVACKLLVGLDQGSATPLGHHFEIWCGGLFSVPLPLPWTRFGQAKRSRKTLLAEIATLITQRQQSPSDTQEDALSLLLNAEDEQGEKLSAEELQLQIMLLLFAGHETLTSSLCTFLLQTALHPDTMERLRLEQTTLRDQPVTLELLRQMPYLEQVMREVLRFTPPVGGVFRKILKTCEYQGYRLPQGWAILCPINATHQDADYYPDPDRFNPDRFADLEANQPKYSYIPFGGGIRECLGKEFARLEMKLFAIHLLRHYRWELLPEQNLELTTIPTPAPRDGLKVRFQAL